MKAILLGLLLVLSVVEANQLRAAPGPMDNLIETLRGVFESWEVNKEEVEKLLLCVADLKDIEFQIEQILEELKKLDLKDILKLVEIITRIIGEVQQVFKDIEPCLDSTGEIKKLINKFINLTPIEMLNRIIKHIMYSGKEIYDAIMKIIQGYKDKSYYVIGYNIGEIIELLFFKD